MAVEVQASTTPNDDLDGRTTQAWICRPRLVVSNEHFYLQRRLQISL